MSEVKCILNNLSSMPGFNTTTDKKTAKELLKYDFVFCNGNIRDIIVTNKGLGVYKVSSKPRKNNL